MKSTPTNKKEKGNVLLEFAIGFSMMVPLFLGLFQFGYTFYVYNQLNTAVRSGGRYAANRTYDSPTSTPSTAYSNAVKNVVVYGSPTGGTTPIVSGLTTSHVRVQMVFSSNAPVRVVVDINGFSVNNLFRPYTMSGKPKATFSYFGRWAPV